MNKAEGRFVSPETRYTDSWESCSAGGRGLEMSRGNVSVWRSVVLVAAAMAGATAASAAIPHHLNIQGVLYNSSGQPYSGVLTVTFRIYKLESGGTVLWEEPQDVTFDEGRYSVLLGSVTALDLPFTEDYWLQMDVGAEVLLPRHRIAASGYAYNAETVNGVPAEAAATANSLLPLDGAGKFPNSVLNVGTGPDQLVALDGAAKLPAVDGSQLTNLTQDDFVLEAALVNALNLSSAGIELFQATNMRASAFPMDTAVATANARYDSANNWYHAAPDSYSAYDGVYDDHNDNAVSGALWTTSVDGNGLGDSTSGGSVSEDGGEYLRTYAWSTKSMNRWAYGRATSSLPLFLTYGNYVAVRIRYLRLTRGGTDGSGYASFRIQLTDGTTTVAACENIYKGLDWEKTVASGPYYVFLMRTDPSTVLVKDTLGLNPAWTEVDISGLGFCRIQYESYTNSGSATDRAATAELHVDETAYVATSFLSTVVHAPASATAPATALLPIWEVDSGGATWSVQFSADGGTNYDILPRGTYGAVGMPGIDFRVRWDAATGATDYPDTYYRGYAFLFR